MKKRLLIILLFIPWYTFSVSHDCDLSPLSISDFEQSNQQDIDLDSGQRLSIYQWLSQRVTEEHNAKVVKNITCQKLRGARYTGSDEEWAGVISNAVNGLANAKAKDIELTIVGDDRRVYTGSVNNTEYILRFKLSGNQQVVYNFTVLDLIKNEALTISVSGNIVAESEIINDYKRLVELFNI